MYKYYGVSSNDGFGVFDSYNKAEMYAIYLEDPLIKEFDNDADAFKWASEHYNTFYNEVEIWNFCFHGNYCDELINHFFYLRDVMESNR